MIYKKSCDDSLRLQFVEMFTIFEKWFATQFFIICIYKELVCNQLYYLLFLFNLNEYLFEQGFHFVVNKYYYGN